MKDTEEQTSPSLPKQVRDRLSKEGEQDGELHMSFVLK